MARQRIKKVGISATIEEAFSRFVASATARGLSEKTIQTSRLQVPLNQFYHAFVVDILSQQIHQQFVIQGVEILGQVYQHRTGISFFRILLYFLNRLLCAPVRAVAVAIIREQRFVDWNQLLCDCLLDDAVYDSWNAQLSDSAIRLWNFLSAYRLGFVFPFFPSLPAISTTDDSVQLLDFDLLGSLVLVRGLIYGFCSSGQSFAAIFLQIPPHDGHP